MNSAITQNLEDGNIRLGYSKRALAIPFWLGVGFILWGLVMIFADEYLDRLHDLFRWEHWSFFFGLGYLGIHYYMRVFGYMILNQVFLKRLNFFQTKLNWEDILSCQLTEGYLLLKTSKKHIMVHREVIAKKSFEFLLKQIKEKGIPMES